MFPMYITSQANEVALNNTENKQRNHTSESHNFILFKWNTKLAYYPVFLKLCWIMAQKRETVRKRRRKRRRRGRRRRRRRRRRRGEWGGGWGGEEEKKNDKEKEEEEEEEEEEEKKKQQLWTSRTIVTTGGYRNKQEQSLRFKTYFWNEQNSVSLANSHCR